MNIITQHKLLSAIVVIVVIGAAWYEFTGSAAPASVLSTTDVATDTGESNIVTTLLQLQAVNLNGTILTDPGFLALQDFTTQVVNEPVGRSDPFAPVPGSVTPSTSTVQVNPNLFAPAKN